MRTVYEAASGVEAHMVLHMLEQAGIDGRIDGEYLAGGVGELPAMGLVRVLVDPADATRAREIIAAWEQKQPAAADPERGVRQARFRTVIAILVGCVVGGGLVWIALRSPQTRAGIDYDNDGRLEETYVYNGVQLSRIEVDRNADGKPDLIYDWNVRGIPDAARSDADFDGVFESSTKYRAGQPELAQADLTGDAMVDYQAHFVDGVIVSGEYTDPATGQVRKRIQFRDEMPTSAQLDTDGDGRLETEHTYDWMGEIASTRRVP